MWCPAPLLVSHTSNQLIVATAVGLGEARSAPDMPARTSFRASPVAVMHRLSSSSPSSSWLAVHLTSTRGSVAAGVLDRRSCCTRASVSLRATTSSCTRASRYSALLAGPGPAPLEAAISRMIGIALSALSTPWALHHAAMASSALCPRSLSESIVLRAEVADASEAHHMMGTSLALHVWALACWRFIASSLGSDAISCCASRTSRGSGVP